MCPIDQKGRKPQPGDLVTFTYWSFSEKKNKYGLVVSIYERELRVNNETEDNKNYVSMILLLQNGEIKEYYAFSDDMIVIHTR